MTKEEFIQNFVIKNYEANEHIEPESEINYRERQISKLIEKGSLLYQEIKDNIS